MPRKVTPALRRQLHEDNQKFPPYMVRVPERDWPDGPGRPNIVELWRSRGFVAQVWVPAFGAQCVSVNRTSIGDDCRWRDGITWDELMEVKRQIGRGDAWALEVYPPEAEVKNVANMRHLWLVPEAPPWAWQPSKERA